MWCVGVSGNILINEDADRVNSYTIWNYAEGHDTYYASMLVDLTLPPGEVRDLLSWPINLVSNQCAPQRCTTRKLESTQTAQTVAKGS